MVTYYTKELIHEDRKIIATFWSLSWHRIVWIRIDRDKSGPLCPGDPILIELITGFIMWNHNLNYFMDEYLKTDNIARGFDYCRRRKPIRPYGHRVGGKFEI
jgi:hypothetical protein